MTEFMILLLLKGKILFLTVQGKIGEVTCKLYNKIIIFFFN